MSAFLNKMFQARWVLFLHSDSTRFDRFCLQLSLRPWVRFQQRSLCRDRVRAISLTSFELVDGKRRRDFFYQPSLLG
jgi:hypothetical protein